MRTGVVKSDDNEWSLRGTAMSKDRDEGCRLRLVQYKSFTWAFLDEEQVEFKVLDKLLEAKVLASCPRLQHGIYEHMRDGKGTGVLYLLIENVWMVSAQEWGVCYSGLYVPDDGPGQYVRPVATFTDKFAYRGKNFPLS